MTSLPTHRDEAAAILAAARDRQLDTAPGAPAYEKLIALAHFGASVMFANEHLIEDAGAAVWFNQRGLRGYLEKDDPGCVTLSRGACNDVAQTVIADLQRKLR